MFVIVIGVLSGIVGFGLLAFGALILFGATRFAPVQSETVYNKGGTQRLLPGQKIKVLSWNVQYMAGKNHVFFYDMQNNKGPDLRSTPAEQHATLQRVAAVIRAENPDVVLLQEVDDGCGRSDGADQLAQLLALLPGEYANHASAFYWQAAFVPHPKVWGSAGMKLSVLSKFPLASAKRHALANVPRPFYLQAFNIHRAMLEVRLPLQNGQEFALVNTHLEAFVEGSPVMATQAAQLDSLLRGLTAQGVAWIAGGDLNLLPPGEFERLHENERWLYNPHSEMELLYKNHAVLPSLEQATGADREKYWTHFPNRPWAYGPDRVIDYLLYAPAVQASAHQVLSQGNLDVSDHLPVVAEFVVP